MRLLSVFVLLLAVVALVTPGKTVTNLVPHTVQRDRALTHVAGDTKTNKPLRGVKTLDSDTEGEERGSLIDVLRRLWAKLCDFIAKFRPKQNPSPNQEIIVPLKRNTASRIGLSAHPPPKTASGISSPVDSRLKTAPLTDLTRPKTLPGADPPEQKTVPRLDVSALSPRKTAPGGDPLALKTLPEVRLPNSPELKTASGVSSPVDLEPKTAPRLDSFALPPQPGVDVSPVPPEQKTVPQLDLSAPFPRKPAPRVDFTALPPRETAPGPVSEQKTGSDAVLLNPPTPKVEPGSGLSVRSKRNPPLKTLNAHDTISHLLANRETKSEFAATVQTPFQLPPELEAELVVLLNWKARVVTSMLLSGSTTVNACRLNDRTDYTLAKYVLFYELTVDHSKGEDMYGVEELLRSKAITEDELLALIADGVSDKKSTPPLKAIAERFRAGLLTKWLNELKSSDEVMTRLKAENEGSLNREAWEIYHAEQSKMLKRFLRGASL